MKMGWLNPLNEPSFREKPTQKVFLRNGMEKGPQKIGGDPFSQRNPE